MAVKTLHFSHLLGGAIFTVNIATVPAVVLPVGQTEPSVAAGAVGHLGVVLPLTSRLLHHLNLQQFRSQKS